MRSTTLQNLLNEGDAARHIGLSVATLRKRRMTGDELVYMKLGKVLRYSESDQTAFLESKRVAPKSTTIEAA